MIMTLATLYCAVGRGGSSKVGLWHLPSGAVVAKRERELRSGDTSCCGFSD
jgi:hypothetical protein